MKKVCKYSLAAAILVFLLCQSVYFKDLKEIREQRRRDTFNAAQYAEDFWLNRLPSVLDEAIEARELIALLNTNMAEAIERYGNTPGVSRVYAYLLKGEGTILAMGAESLSISITGPGANAEIVLATGLYIPGNAVRDASGLIDVSKFSDTMKFNEIGNEINKIIVKDVIRPFLSKSPAAGATVRFLGAAQVSEDAGAEDGINTLKVIPIRLEMGQ